MTIVGAHPLEKWGGMFMLESFVISFKIRNKTYSSVTLEEATILCLSPVHKLAVLFFHFQLIRKGPGSVPEHHMVGLIWNFERIGRFCSLK